MTSTNLSFDKGELISIYTTGKIASVSTERTTLGDRSHFSATVSFAAFADGENDSWDEGELTA
jgi:hypothetical protein